MVGNCRPNLLQIIRWEVETLKLNSYTFATRSIEAGVPPLVLKKWLGHTNIHITLDTYSDVFDKMNFESTDKLDLLMGSLMPE